MKKKQITSLALAAMTLATMAPTTMANAGTKVGPADADAPLGRYSVGDLIKTNDFEDGVGLPWNQVETYPADGDFSIKNGKYNVTVNKTDKDRWGVQFRHRGLTLQAGHRYHVVFELTADADCKVYAKIGDQGDPYDEYWNNNWNPFEVKKGQTTRVDQYFTMPKNKEACEMAFHLTGDCAPSNASQWTVSLDNVHIYDDQFIGYPIEEAEPTNAIAVNQVGYFPNAQKVATADCKSNSPVAWKLLNSSGKVVASGETKYKGKDAASGDNIHLIDFSSYKTPGKGYKLEVDSSAVDSSKHASNQSLSFEIGEDLYSQMKYDAIKYFYHNRSGIDIEMPYADSEELTRGAGHRSDVMPNFPNTWYTNETGANYRLDISKGWYDAGDHGKYVVNGGISTWTMQNQYERALYIDKDVSKAPFADNTINIPESGNKVPDIMDESRFNLETLLKMQIPDGTNKYDGMVHHKAHDEFWTALAIKPEEDPQRRFLQPPSTAATLNLAAIAAQGSRMWKEYDSAFASKCLKAAERAWEAAMEHPDIFAPLTGGTGGGAYGDNKVTDEFYWAACELYATTGKTEYLNYLKSSEYYLKMPTELTGGEDNGLSGVFDWGNVQGLGTITLATVPNNLGETEIQKARDNIIKAADILIANEESEGYRTPMKPCTLEKDGVTIRNAYPWGSNSFVANQTIVMAYANDFAKLKGIDNNKYINGAATAMNYLLGNNPNVQSYVTGYGENKLENPHHRFWSYQADNSFPKAPAGCMSGGPNSGLEDPWVKGSGWQPGQMPAAKCFMDNIESWSTNEITINWNAPMAWISSYMDDHKGDFGTTSVPPENGDNHVNGDGDVNGDGKVNIKDYVKLQKYVMNPSSTTIDEAASDLNGDGKVNVTDLMMLKKQILG